MGYRVWKIFTQNHIGWEDGRIRKVGRGGRVCLQRDCRRKGSSRRRDRKGRADGGLRQERKDQDRQRLRRQDNEGVQDVRLCGAQSSKAYVRRQRERPDLARLSANN